MYNYEGSPSLMDCIFMRNWAYQGAGMWNEANSNPRLTNCTFIENHSDDWGGGGMGNVDSHPKLINCKFLRNRSVDGGWWGYGAGMHNLNSSPVLMDCTFIANGGGNRGGGMYNRADDGTCAPTLINCTFSQNDVSAMWNEGKNGQCTPILINCLFSENTGWRGGGMSSEASHPILTNCTFSGNSSGQYGGGMCNEESNPRLSGCTFSGNVSKGGGGMYNRRESSPVLTNCTFSGNYAVYEANHSDGSGISMPGQGGAVYNDRDSRLTLTNCILWGDSPDEIWLQSHATSILTVTYGNIQGTWPGEGNIDVNPYFVDPGHWGHVDDPTIMVEPLTPNDPNVVWVDGDYHLKSQYGRWEPDSESWVTDDVTSPCIDAGDPNSPIALEPFPNGSRINMGTYGGTEDASKSP
jgi:hypothetical protein